VSGKWEPDTSQFYALSGEENSAADSIQTALADFEHYFNAFLKALDGQAELKDLLLDGTEEWRRLLSQKLLTQISEKACLIVVFAGGTNSGKSTLFNLTLQKKLSEVRSTAAATKAPVLAVAPERLPDAINNKILVDFHARNQAFPGQSENPQEKEDLLYVASAENLPFSMALMDTPDVDSVIEKNWSIAEKIRAAGDVMIAVLTPQKYNDEKNVAFFRIAHQSGRIIVPLMNRVEPSHTPDITKAQLNQFMGAIGFTAERAFTVPKDYSLESLPDLPIMDLENQISLLDYLKRMDMGTVKIQVYKASLEYFLEQTASFLERCKNAEAQIRAFNAECLEEAEKAAAVFSPERRSNIKTGIRQCIQTSRSVIVQKMSFLLALLSPLYLPLKNFIFKDDVQISQGKNKKQFQVDSAKENAARAQDAIRDSVLIYSNWFRKKLNEATKDTSFFLLKEPRDNSANVEVIRKTLEKDAEGLVPEDTLLGTGLQEGWPIQSGKITALQWIDATFVLAPYIFLLLLLYKGLSAIYPIICILPVFYMLLHVRRIIERSLEKQIRVFLSPAYHRQKERLKEELYRVVAKPIVGAVESALALFDEEHIKQLGSCREKCQKNMTLF